MILGEPSALTAIGTFDGYTVALHGVGGAAEVVVQGTGTLRAATDVELRPHSAAIAERLRRFDDASVWVDVDAAPFVRVGIRDWRPIDDMVRAIGVYLAEHDSGDEVRIEGLSICLE